MALTARRFLIGLALAWLVPLGTHAIGVDLVLPVLLVAALVAVQRGATTLLDRAVLALGQLFGALCVGGLVISWWPWGFNPVPMFGVSFTVLAVLGRLRGVSEQRLRSVSEQRLRGVSEQRLRGASWPTIGGRRDVLVVLGWLGVTAFAAVPFVTRDRAGRLAIMSPGEDLVRHFGLYDAIGHVQGYAFLHIDEAKPILPDVGLLTYPQGTHLLYALLGRFAGIGSRSGRRARLVHLVRARLVFVPGAGRAVGGPPGRRPGRAGAVAGARARAGRRYLIFGDLDRRTDARIPERTARPRPGRRCSSRSWPARCTGVGEQVHHRVRCCWSACPSRTTSTSRRSASPR